MHSKTSETLTLGAIVFCLIITSGCGVQFNRVEEPTASASDSATASPGTVILSVAPSSFTFVEGIDDCAAKTFVVTNSGTAATAALTTNLLLNDVTIDPPYLDFLVDNCSGNTLTAQGGGGNTCTLSLSYDATQINNGGSKTGTLTITSGSSSVTVPLTATGTAAVCPI